MALGGIDGYWAEPSTTGPWPAVIVIQEWWGLDRQTESVADRLASEGYLAFAPDLFHGERAELGDHAKAMELTQKYSNRYSDELAAVFDTLKTLSGTTGKIASLGFCFGGKMSLSLGLYRPLNAVVTFYGGQMQVLFDKMANWSIPVLAFFGDEDVSIPQGTIDELKTLLQARKVEHKVTVYPHSGHAFFRDSDPAAYRPDAAKDAWAQTKDFLSRKLKG